MTESNQKWLPKLLANRKLYTEALLKRPESLASHLPYSEYLERHGVFTLKDGSLGTVYAVGLVEHETLEEKQLLRVIESAGRWFRLPENCVLQLHYENARLSPHDGQLAKHAASYPEAHPLSQEIFDQRVAKIREACGDNLPTAPMRKNLLLAIRYFPEQAWPSRWGLGSTSEPLSELTSQFLNELNKFRSLLNSVESSDAITLKRLNGADLVDFLRRFFNPITYYQRPFAPLSQHQDIAEQLIYTSSRLNHEGIEREGIKTRTISLKTAPAYSYPGSMTRFVGLDFPFRLSINISFPAAGQVKRFLGTKEFFLDNALSAKARIQKAEVAEVQEALARQDRCLSMTFTVTVEGRDDDELAARVQRLCQIFNHDLECEVIEERDIGVGLCLNGLPLNYSPDADLSARRAIRILKSDILNFLPLFDSFNGTRDPVALYQSREGSLAPFSLLENQTSNHTVVLADTGSGKSAFVLNWLQAVKRLNPEPIIFIIDKKSSYASLSKHFDGDMTVFERGQAMPFSPFRGVFDEEKVAFLTKMLLMAVQLTSSNFQPESEHQMALAMALRNAHSRLQQKAGVRYEGGKLVERESSTSGCIGMDDVVVELGQLAGKTKKPEEKRAIEALITKLRPFYGEGIYAQFFAAAEQKQAGQGKLLYIYDLDALDGDPVLQTLMTMAVIEEIRSTLALPEHKGRTGFLVMEEFAMLGRNNPAFRDFAIDFAETMRKRGCWLMTLTPRPQNYFELDVGRAFWGVADNFIFLQMSRDNVDYIAEKSALLDQASQQIIASLRTKKNQYAEIYYMNKSGTYRGAFRYVQTDLEKQISTY